jgi:hypothetical protein
MVLYVGCAGVLFVRLVEEEDGRINLLGYPCDSDSDGSDHGNSTNSDLLAARTDDNVSRALTPPPQVQQQQFTTVKPVK